MISSLTRPSWNAFSGTKQSCGIWISIAPGRTVGASMLNVPETHLTTNRSAIAAPAVRRTAMRFCSAFSVYRSSATTMVDATQASVGGFLGFLMRGRNAGQHYVEERLGSAYCGDTNEGS